MGIQKSVELNEKSDATSAVTPPVRKRFFIALLPPEEVRAKANEIKGGDAIAMRVKQLFVHHRMSHC